MLEVQKYCRGAPVFLVGLKIDTRVGSGLWAPLFPAFDTRIAATEVSATHGLLNIPCLLRCY